MTNEELKQSKNKMSIIIGMLKNSDGILERQNLITHLREELDTLAIEENSDGYEDSLYYNEEEVTTITSDDYILEDNKFIEFVRQKAITLLDNDWRPIEKEVKTTITELPNTLEYL